MFSNRIQAGLIGALSILMTGTGFGATFPTSPALMQFSNGVTSGLFHQSRSATPAVRFSLRLYEWREANHLDVHPPATEEFSLFPKAVTVEPGIDNVVRLTSIADGTNRERVYRLMVHELPGPEASQDGTVYFETSMSIPVFFRAETANQADDVQADNVQAESERALLKASGEMNSVAVIAVENEGDLTMSVKSVRLVGRTSDGTVLFDGQQKGWHLLPDSSRSYAFELPQGACSAATIQFEVEGETDTYRREFPMGAACPMRSASL